MNMVASGYKAHTKAATQTGTERFTAPRYLSEKNLSTRYGSRKNLAIPVFEGQRHRKMDNGRTVPMRGLVDAHEGGHSHHFDKEKMDTRH